MNIRDALSKLDPDVDDQWTADGMPRVDVVAEMVDNEDLKRADITSADPDFTRERAIQAKDRSASPADNPDEEEEVKEGTVKVPQEAIPEPEPELPVVVQIAPEVPLTALELLERELEVCTTEMYVAQSIHKDAKREADDAADRVNALNRRIEVMHKADPNHATAGIRAYLRQQQINRVERAKRVRAFLDGSGLTLKEVSKEMDPKSALDKAMAGRKPPRGSVRPVYTKS